MNSPFGSSNQGGYQGGAQQQSWGGGQGFGGGFSGFQPQQQSFGNFGGGAGFGGYGGGFGNFGGGFNPFQGGYGGGFNPMFGGIGGLGFNPMMGPQFGMPMQGFGGFNPYQPEMLSARDPYRANESGMPMPGPTGRESFDNPRSMDMMYRGGPQMSPEMRQRREQDMRSAEGMAQNPYLAQQQELEKQMLALPEYQALENANKAFQGSEAFKSIQQKQQDLQRQIQQRQPMFGGIGGLGGGPGQHDRINNPFTGPQRSAKDILSMAVGNMPQDMQYDMNKDGKITSADALAYQRQYGQQPQTPQTPSDSGMNRGVDNMSIGPGFGSRQPMFGGIGGLGFNPMMGPQFGMPMKQIQSTQYENPQQRQVAEAEKARWAALTPEQQSNESNALRARSQQEYSPLMGPQFGMPMLQGMQANSAQARAAMGSLGDMNIRPLSAEQQQLLSQLPQQTQSAPSGSSFAQLAQMFGGRMPQASSGPQQAAPPGMKWMQGYGGYSLVPESMNTYEMG